MPGNLARSSPIVLLSHSNARHSFCLSHWSPSKIPQPFLKRPRISWIMRVWCGRGEGQRQLPLASYHSPVTTRQSDGWLQTAVLEICHPPINFACCICALKRLRPEKLLKRGCPSPLGYFCWMDCSNAVYTSKEMAECETPRVQ